jgi:hypothetical protein
MDLRPLRKGAHYEEKREGIKRDVAAHLHFFDQYRPHIFLEGNHDHRLRYTAEWTEEGTSAQEHAQELQERLDMHYAKAGCQRIPYEINPRLQEWRAPEGGPVFAHGYKHNQLAAKAQSELHLAPCIFGHVHRLSVWQTPKGISMSSPCLADLSKLHYDISKPHKSLHRNGWVYGVINTKTGGHQAWYVIKEDGEWMSPQGKL